MQLNCSCPMNLPQDKPRAKASCSSCAVAPLEEAGCWTYAKGKRGGKKGQGLCLTTQAQRDLCGQQSRAKGHGTALLSAAGTPGRAGASRGCAGT